jgi:hypothetical protein
VSLNKPTAVEHSMVQVLPEKLTANIKEIITNKCTMCIIIFTVRTSYMFQPRRIIFRENSSYSEYNNTHCAFLGDYFFYVIQCTDMEHIKFDSQHFPVFYGIVKFTAVLLAGPYAPPDESGPHHNPCPFNDACTQTHIKRKYFIQFNL